MGFSIDERMHWTDHYVEHGFCVIKNALTDEFCQQGIETIQRALGTTLPPSGWTTQSIDVAHRGGRVSLRDPEVSLYLERAYDQPGIRDMLATMFGGIEHWSGERAAHPFLCIFDPDNKQQLSEHGHVDFNEVRIPLLGNGFVFHASLVNTEPFSGNIMIFPGWHKVVQKILLEDPNFWYGDREPYNSRFLSLMPDVEPYEFVAEAGDMLLMHHQVGHAGNSNAATSHSPRLAIHGQAICDHWLTRIDPAADNLTPWERSFAHHGSIELDYDEAAKQAAAYAERAARKDKPTNVGDFKPDTK